MNILLTAILLLAVSFTLHWLWWRVILPRNQTMTLLRIFLLTPLAVCAAMITLGQWNLSVLESLQLALVYLSTALVYIANYSAMEHATPTLSLVQLLKRSGANGLSRDELYAMLKLESAIETRIALMERTGLIERHGPELALKPKGLQLARLFTLGARIFGLKAGG